VVFLVDKVALGRVSPSTLVSPANSHSTDCSTLIIIVTLNDYRRGFGLVIRFIAHLQIVTTSNHSAIANSHTLPFTTAHTKSSQSAMPSASLVW
jgi:hypothetical protein